MGNVGCQDCSSFFLHKRMRMNAASYHHVLEKHMLPPWDIQNLDMSMQDGAHCHKTKTTMTWLRDHNIPVLEWPSQFPDLYH